MYIIFRVYNLLSDKIDVKLYVDPLELQRQGKLTFKTDGKFTVTARSCQGGFTRVKNTARCSEFARTSKRSRIHLELCLLFF